MHEELCIGYTALNAIGANRGEARGNDEAPAAVALALHELAVNALIHGAFSTPEGHVAVEWSIVSESGTFGMEVIERTLPYELSARTSIAFGRNGAHYDIRMPQNAATQLWRLSPES